MQPGWWFHSLLVVPRGDLLHQRKQAPDGGLRPWSGASILVGQGNAKRLPE